MSPVSNKIERIGAATLFLGDCLEILPTLSGFDAVIMDPPYAIPTQVAATREATRSVGDLSLVEATFRVVFNAVADALRPGGRAFCFCDGASYPVVYRAAYNRFSLACLVWDKGRIGMGREFRKSHELILHCWTGETPVFSDGKGRPDVFRFAPVGENRDHPAEKPIALINHLLTVCRGRIADPFMGSGVTGAASIARGHEFVGIEIEPRYFDAACRRIEAAERQRDLLAPIEAEDTADAEAARVALAQIAEHPESLLSGAALDLWMADWIKEGAQQAALLSQEVAKTAVPAPSSQTDPGEFHADARQLPEKPVQPACGRPPQLLLDAVWREWCPSNSVLIGQS